MTAAVENPHAGQGAVLLDIGGEVGALVVTAPPELIGVEVEIWPATQERPSGHVPHVAVVDRPVEGRSVPSLVYPELRQGSYSLAPVGSGEAMRAEVRGGEVTTTTWPV